MMAVATAPTPPAKVNKLPDKHMIKQIETRYATLRAYEAIAKVCQTKKLLAAESNV